MAVEDLLIYLYTRLLIEYHKVWIKTQSNSLEEGFSQFLFEIYISFHEMMWNNDFMSYTLYLCSCYILSDALRGCSSASWMTRRFAVTHEDQLCAHQWRFNHVCANLWEINSGNEVHKQWLPSGYWNLLGRQKSCINDLSISQECKNVE